MATVQNLWQEVGENLSYFLPTGCETSGSDAVQMRPSLVSHVTRCTLARGYWRFGTIYHSHLQVLRTRTALRLKIDCTGTSVANYQSTLRNMTEERTPELVFPYAKTKFLHTLRVTDRNHEQSPSQGPLPWPRVKLRTTRLRASRRSFARRSLIEIQWTAIGCGDRFVAGSPAVSALFACGVF